MPAEGDRFVWLFVFFDLPVGTKVQRRDASRFRNFLKDDGFMMLQFSVYARVCRAEDGAMKHIARVTRALPGKRQRSRPPGHRPSIRPDAAVAGRSQQNRVARLPPDGPAVIFCSARSEKSQHSQRLTQE